MVSAEDPGAPTLQQVCRASDACPAAVQDVRIDHGGRDIRVSQQFLDCANIVLTEGSTLVSLVMTFQINQLTWPRCLIIDRVIMLHSLLPPGIILYVGFTCFGQYEKFN